MLDLCVSVNAFKDDRVSSHDVIRWTKKKLIKHVFYIKFVFFSKQEVNPQFTSKFDHKNIFIGNKLPFLIKGRSNIFGKLAKIADRYVPGITLGKPSQGSTRNGLNIDFQYVLTQLIRGAKCVYILSLFV